MIRVSSSDKSMIGCDVLCCDVVLWPMEGGVLACGTPRADKSCAACRVPSMEGQFEGKRGRGRQREKIMDGLATWLGPGKVSDILAAVKDRDLWRDMIANAYKQGT
ncbi:hypothetical protein PoB_001700000 [Plakobranchus ocellatus]|uniref:Uncharacterized protein n=1 Tax=Plakobranchus ocellatus TaxID=259542 RepID=A0AAV3Z5R5_9GAST|nr:hypothetical protein PoB_001700000 [Plakobranchus ocellatus]